MTVPTPKDDPEAVVHRSKIEAVLYRWLKGIFYRDEGGWDYIIDVALDVLDLTKEELDEVKLRAYAEREAEEHDRHERWELEDTERERAQGDG